NRLDGSPNAVSGPSDGYATGFVIYLLRQTGMTARERAIERGVAWLQTNQRESGRWFTRSLNADRNHYLTNAGTAFALLALEGIDLLWSSGRRNRFAPPFQVLHEKLEARLVNGHSPLN